MKQKSPGGAPSHAIIYCRVSSKKQKTEGDGLNSQEHRCRQYAELRGLTVDAVFSDDITGGGDFMKRPGMAGVLSYLKKNCRHRYVVIFDDLKRFARDTRFHLTLRDTLAQYQASVECLNFRFEDTPEGRFVETVVAAGGELERHQNGRQAVQKMTARVERGYFVTRAPVGYRYEDSKREGRVLVPDEPFASIMREALEGYASGRFDLQVEVVRFLENHPEWPRNQSGKRAQHVNETRVSALLRHPVYAGIVAAPYWGVSARKGLHEALISLETHQAILHRLNGNRRAPARKDLSDDFALRGAVLCGCGSPLTAGWSKGRAKSYPYYLCHNRGCTAGAYGKSIARGQIEGEFEALLQSLVPTEALFKAAFRMFKDLWEDRQRSAWERARDLKARLAQTERQISVLLDRIVEATQPDVVQAYEARIAALSTEKLVLSEKIAKSGQPSRSFEQSLRTACDFLANPYKVWNSGRLEDRRTVLKLAFTRRLEYIRNQGFRTADIALPFRLLAQAAMPEDGMVGATGIEPVTPCV